MKMADVFLCFRLLAMIDGNQYRKKSTNAMKIVVAAIGAATTSIADVGVVAVDG